MCEKSKSSFLLVKEKGLQPSYRTLCSEATRESNLFKSSAFPKVISSFFVLTKLHFDSEPTRLYQKLYQFPLISLSHTSFSPRSWNWRTKFLQVHRSLSLGFFLPRESDDTNTQLGSNPNPRLWELGFFLAHGWARTSRKIESYNQLINLASEIMQVLKPGGFLVLLTASADDGSSMYSL